MIIRKIKSTLRTNRMNRKILSEVERAFRLNRGGGRPVLLPERLGRNLPERVIEILYARLSYRPAFRILDVGCANAMESHLRMIDRLERPCHFVGIDISPPAAKVLRRYDEFICESIISSRLADASFDLIWCISALEHFGMDNSSYTDQFVISPNMDAQAVREMVRLLAPVGRLLISVPYGRFEDHAWLRNYDSEHLQDLLAAVEQKTKVEKAFFRHTYGSGWCAATPEELRYVGYYDQANSGGAGLAVVIVTKPAAAGE